MIDWAKAISNKLMMMMMNLKVIQLIIGSGISANKINFDVCSYLLPSSRQDLTLAMIFGPRVVYVFSIFYFTKKLEFSIQFVRVDPIFVP
jgi:hypothetical protein